jgi:hypothetical protein
MRGVLNGALEGYILLDTGTSYPAISLRTTQALKSSLVSVVDLRGANGAVKGDLIAAGARFHVAGRGLAAELVVALNAPALMADKKAGTR